MALASRLCIVSVVALQGCQILDGVDQDAPDQDASSIEITSLPVAPAYPELRTVPPRPQLSYSVEQHREIVERLIGDREHARYTNRQIRYRTGLSSLPPPPRPEPEDDATSTTADAIVGDGQGIPAPPAPRADVPTGGYGATSDPGATDDGDLGDFIRDMVEETEPLPPPASEPAPADDPAPPASDDSSGVKTSPQMSAAPASHSRAPTSGDPSATRLFAWIDEVKNAAPVEPEDASREPEASAPGGAVPVQAAALPQPDGARANAASEVQLAAASEPATMMPGTDGDAPRDASGRSPSPPPVSPPPRRNPDEVTASPAAGTALATLTFSKGSAELPADATSRLKAALAALEDDGVIEIVGEGEAMTLALDRARAVAVGLMRLGADAGDLKITAERAPADQVRILVGGRAPGD